MGDFLSDLFAGARRKQFEESLHQVHAGSAHLRVAQKRRIEELRVELERVTLLARALAELCLEKGVLTREELQAKLSALAAAAETAPPAPGRTQRRSGPPRKRRG